MKTGDVVDALVPLSWHVQGRLAEAAARHDLSTSQLRLLGILRDREPEMLELARHLNLDKSSVTGLVARAEARGLVDRVAGTTDRRTVLVRLTPAGRTLAGELERDVAAALGPVIDGMTPQQQADFVALVTAVVPTLP
jgi:DNA-binding MarR family transcriptional regulator